MKLYSFKILQNRLINGKVEKVIRYVSVFGHKGLRPEIMYSYYFKDSILYPIEECDLVKRILEEKKIHAEQVEIKDNSFTTEKVDIEIETKNKMLSNKIKLIKKSMVHVNKGK